VNQKPVQVFILQAVSNNFSITVMKLFLKNTLTPRNMEIDTTKTLLERRSVRRYEREPIAPEDLDFIRRAIRNTPTSYNGQQFSVIEVADQTLKEKLAEASGQKQIKTCARAFFFLADYNKIYVAANAKDLQYPEFQATADGLVVGVVDASLAMMSAIVAAQSRGLGTCPIGYARTANPALFRELLNLPPRVLLVCALTVGVPREMPDIKPKQPEDLVIFKNSYGTDNMPRKLLDYDSEIAHYNRTRSGTTTVNDWVAHILDYYRESIAHPLLPALEAQGFNVKS